MARTHVRHILALLLLGLTLWVLPASPLAAAPEEGETLIAEGAFDPNRHGLYRLNTWPNQGEVERDFNATSVRNLIGENTACMPGTSGESCVLTPCAAEFLRFVQEDLLPQGRCLGFSSRLIMYAEHPELAAPSASIWHVRPEEKVYGEIAVDSAKQKLPAVRGWINAYVARDPHTNLMDMIGQMNGADSPVVLLSQQVEMNGVQEVVGHAVVPVLVTRMGNTSTYRVYIVDPNDSHPSDKWSLPYMVVDTAAQSWSYQLPWETIPPWTSTTWSGNHASATNRFGILPTEIFQPDLPLGAPVCTQTQPQNASAAASGLAAMAKQNELQAASNMEEVSVTGGNVLFTDTQGRRFGFVGNTFVREIPGASVDIPFNANPNIPTVYMVPAPYTMSVAAANGQVAEVVKFGNRSTVRISGINAAATVQVPAGGMSVQVSTTVADQVDIGVSTNRDPKGHAGWTELKNLDIGSTAATVQLGDQLVVQGAAGNYDLSLKRVTATGSQSFAVANIPMRDGDTQSIGYGQWNGSASGSMPIAVSNPAGNASGELPNGQPPQISPPAGGGMRPMIYGPMVTR